MSKNRHEKEYANNYTGLYSGFFGHCFVHSVQLLVTQQNNIISILLLHKVDMDCPICRLMKNDYSQIFKKNIF